MDKGTVWMLLGLIVFQEYTHARPPTTRTGHAMSGRCSDLSRALGTLLRHPSAAVGPRNLTEEQLREVVIHVTGLDLFDKQLRNEVMCYVGEGMGDMRHFLSLLYDKGVVFHALRAAYDYFTTLAINQIYSLPFRIEYPLREDNVDVLTAEYELIKAAGAAGVFSQDPNGTQWAVDFVGYFSGFLEDHEPEPLSYASVGVQCRNINEKVYATWEAVKSDLRDWNYEQQIDVYRDAVRAWTGVDIEDREAVEETLCGILGAIQYGGLRRLYEFIKDEGMVDYAFRQFYYVVIDRINAIERYIEDVEERLADPDSGWIYQVLLPDDKQASLEAIERVFDILSEMGFMNMEDNLGTSISL